VEVRKDSGLVSDNGRVDPAAAARWSDLKLAAQRLLSPSVPFLADSITGRRADRAESHGAGNTLESDAFVITPEAAAKWSDPKVAAQRLLSGSVPFLADQVVAHPPASVEPTDATSALESEPASHNVASRWDDLKLAAQLLTGTSACSVTDTLVAYARARRLTLEEATSALEAWNPAKHPRGAFPQNRGWWSPTAGPGSHADSEPVHGSAMAKIPPVGAATAALIHAPPTKAVSPTAPASRICNRSGYAEAAHPAAHTSSLGASAAFVRFSSGGQPAGESVKPIKPDDRERHSPGDQLFGSRPPRSLV